MLFSVVHVCAGTCVAVAELIHDVTCVPGTQQEALLLTTEPKNRSSSTGTGSLIIQEIPETFRF